jgi:hypothetical protein
VRRDVIHQLRDDRLVAAYNDANHLHKSLGHVAARGAFGCALSGWRHEAQSASGDTAMACAGVRECTLTAEFARYGQSGSRARCHFESLDRGMVVDATGMNDSAQSR